MNRQVINSNILNQINNPHLYEKDLFSFLLNNCDFNELQKKEYEKNFSLSKIYCFLNFSAFLSETRKQTEEPKLINLINQIYDKFGDKLANPIIKGHYFAKKSEECLEITSNIIEFFHMEFNQFFREIQNKKRPQLTYNEEFIFLNFILNNTYSYYEPKNDIKYAIMDILKNQYDTLIKINKGKKADLFFENANLQPLLAILKIEDLEELNPTFKNTHELVELHINKLYKKKIFLLSKYLSNKAPNEVLDSLTKLNPNAKFFLEHFSSLIYVGISVNGEALIKAYKNLDYAKVINQSSMQTDKKTSKAIDELVNMAIYLKDVMPMNEQTLVGLYLASICSKREHIYKNIRRNFGLSNDSNFCDFLITQKINNRTVLELEKEILFEGLQEILPKNHVPTVQKLKI